MNYKVINKNLLKNEIELKIENKIIYLKLKPNESLQDLDALQLGNIIRSRVLNELVGE